MSAAQDLNRMDLETYLATEAGSEVRREWMNGEVVAMAGAGPAHNRVKEAVVALLWSQLGARGCASYSSDQRVQIEATGAYVYPDVVVACGPRFGGAAPESLLNPSAVFEVLSPSTAAYDLGPKFAHYSRCPTLRDFVALDPDTRFAQHYQRQADGRWVVTPLDGRAPEATVALAIEGVSLSLIEIFAVLDEV